MKIVNHFNSQIDFFFSSLVTFMIFVYIKSTFGIDIAGFFGLIISIAAFLETVQQGLYDRPAYLGLPIGIQKFKLKKIHIFLASLILNLILERFVLSGYLIETTVYVYSLVLLQNIRTADYVNNNIQVSAIRSFTLFILKFIFLFFGYLEIINISFKILIYFLAILNTFFVYINKHKIFSISHPGINNSSKLLLTSLLILLKSRLPLWVLFPFGLGLIGIFETFRTLIEVFLLPAKGILKVMINELNKSNNRIIFRYGLNFGLFSSFFVFLGYSTITKLEIYNHKEILNNYSKFSLIIIVLFFWLTESLSMVLQNKQFLDFEFNRRLNAIIIFLFINLVFFKFITYNIFLLNVALIYVVEVLQSFFFIRNRFKLM